MRCLPCPLCGATTFKLRYEAQLEGAEDAFHYLTEKPCHYQVVDCAACGMTYSNPIFDEDRIIELYRTCSTAEMQGDAEETAIRTNMRRYIERLRRDSGITKGRLLDIGCGLGHLLAEAEAIGYDATGVDPSEDAVAGARQRTRAGNAICGTYSEALFAPEQFDLITLVHVIDHVVDPLPLLKAMQAHLKPGGYAFIATHNIESLLAKLMGKSFIAWSVQHITYYTPDTLKRMAAAAAFSPVSLRGSLTTYPLGHFVKNGLRNEGLRKAAFATLSALSLSQRQISFPFGNIELICAKVPR